MRTIMTAMATLAALVAMACPSRGEAAQHPLRLDAKIALGGVAGRIDHMAIDPVRSRLFVAELGNNSVGVIDLEQRKVVHRIAGLNEPQGVAYLHKTDMLYVANRGDGSVRYFRGSDYAMSGRVELELDADNIRIDGAANQVIVGYGDGGLAIIDAATNRYIGTMRVKGHPESFQLDPATRDIFVNLPGGRAIVVLDRLSGQQRATWLMPYGGNFAMALDNDRQRVLAAFRDPARLVAFAKETGAVEADVATCSDADDVFLDAKRQRIYVSCGEGAIDVFDASKPDYPHLDRIATVGGARTSFLAPDMDRFLLAVRAQGREPAAIWVFNVVAERVK